MKSLLPLFVLTLPLLFNLTSFAKSTTLPPLTPAQLDELLGPIALYPNPLVALILPASTFTTDIVLAARYLEDGHSPANTENQNWDDSIKALVHYPEVIQ